MKRVLVAVCFLCGSVLQPTPGESFDLDAHRAMSERAVGTAVLDSYLKDRLAFPQGIIEEISNGTTRLEIVEWIRRGAEFEDVPPIRVRHHFHNPTRTWDQAGLRVGGLEIGESLVLWEQDRGQTIGGKHSWHDARASFFQALTATTGPARQKAYAEMFQSLGQLIHLIQDAASPAHTRNDAHLCCLVGVGDRDEFHRWAEVAGNREEALALPSQRFDPSVLTLPPNPLAPVPVARILDTERYRLTGVPEAGLDIGLAEYSNANFLSDDTIFSDLPFPAASSVILGDPELEPKTGEQRRYFKKVADGEIVDHLAVPSALYEFLPETLKGRKKGLDNSVLRDYAAKLLPRAVGYSAGLIDYFIRGRLAIEPVDQTHLRIFNLSAESLVSGTIELFYDTPDEQRVLLATYVLTGPIGPGQSSPPIELLPPSDNGTPGRYWAVFRGQLGQEEDAVIGVVGSVWAEEWDQGLTGRHPWYQTTNDPGEMNALPPGSVVRTEVNNGILTQENTRPSGTTYQRPGSSFPSFQVNQTYLGLVPNELDASHRDAFPLTITPQTELHFKVDVMSIDVPPAVPQCPNNQWGNGAYQHVGLWFDNGSHLELTVPGQQQIATDSLNPFFISLGEELRINLYEALQARGVSITAPLAIELVTITQLFLPPCDPTGEAQQQLVQVDYLRLVDVP